MTYWPQVFGIRHRETWGYASQYIAHRGLIKEKIGKRGKRSEQTHRTELNEIDHLAFSQTQWEKMTKKTLRINAPPLMGGEAYLLRITTENSN